MISYSANGASPDREALIVPTVKNRYFNQDMRFSITLPRAFLHEQERERPKEINQVTFAINLDDNSPTAITPIENPSIVVVSLWVAYHDAIDAALESRDPRYTGSKWSEVRSNDGNGDYPMRNGLKYASGIPFPGSPPTEFLFRQRHQFDLLITCRPSGNAYPSLRTLSSIRPRGGGLVRDANPAVYAEIQFRRERLADWEKIKTQVEHLLQGRVSILNWRDSDARQS